MSRRAIPDRALALGVGLLHWVTLPLLLLAAWWTLSANSTSAFFPPLADILEAFPDTWLEGRLASEALPSLGRLLAGYGLAVVVGVALGVLIGLKPAVRAFCEPTLELFRAIPPPVMIPVLMLFLGIFSTMKVVIIATGCLWPILLNTIEGVRGVDDVLRDTSKTFRFTRLTFLRSVVLRGASPQIFAGARQSLSVGIILMVISEMFAATNGLGFTIVQFQRTFALTQMWTGILLLGVLGVVLAATFMLVQRYALRWYDGLRRAQKER